MKRRENKVLAFLLALAVCLGLCACGGKASASTWQEEYDLGVRYLSEGNYEEAILAFTAAIQIDPKRAEAYLARGGAYIASGETEESFAAALADYEQALELDEGNVEAWLALADVYIRMGDLDKARESLLQGLEKTGGDASIEEKLAELDSDSVTDSSGNVRRRSHYNAEGALVGSFTYTYDRDGWTTSVTAWNAAGERVDFGEDSRSWNEDKTVRRETIYMDYISQDEVWLQRVDSEMTYREDGGMEEFQTYYDRTGAVSGYNRNVYAEDYQCLKMESYDLNGELVSYNVFIYDEAGREVRYEIYLGDGSLSGYEETTYDAAGNPVRNDSYDANGNLTWYNVYEYDDFGNMISNWSYDGNGDLRYSSVEG